MKVEKVQKTQVTKIEELETQMVEIARQHLLVMKQVNQLATLQSEIANQVVAQHNETEALMKGLGLKKDLSYYSFNLHQEEGH